MRFSLPIAMVAALVSCTAAMAEGEGGPRPPRPSVLHGSFVSASGKTLTVATKKEGQDPQEATVSYDDSLKVWVDKSAALAEVKAGQAATVARKDGRPVSGAIKQADARGLTISVRIRGGEEGGWTTQDVEIAADQVAGIVLREVPATLNDVKKGDRVEVTHVEGVARSVRVRLSEPRGPREGREGDGRRRLRATVAKVEGQTLTLTLKADGGRTREETLKTADNVEVIIGGKPAKLADLEAGKPVEVTVREGVVTRVAVIEPRAAGEGEGRREGGDGDRPREDGEGERRREGGAGERRREGGEG